MSAQVVKGFIVALVVIVLAFLGLRLLTSQKTTVTGPLKQAQIVAGPSLSLSPGGGSYTVGQTISVDIVLDTIGDPVMGAEAIVLYNPTLLSVSDENIVAGTIFPAYPVKKVLSEGKLRIVGLITDPNQQQYSGKGTLGKITFTALSAGTADVTIDFVAGGTTKSNVIKLGDANSGINFLSKVQNGKYTIK